MRKILVLATLFTVVAGAAVAYAATPEPCAQSAPVKVVRGPAGPRGPVGHPGPAGNAPTWLIVLAVAGVAFGLCGAGAALGAQHNAPVQGPLVVNNYPPAPPPHP